MQQIAMDIILLFLLSLSKENLKTASIILNENKGIRKEQTVYNKSTTPYSSVDKTFVYKGTNKNEINLVAILPIAKIIVLVIKKLILEFFFFLISIIHSY